LTEFTEEFKQEAVRNALTITALFL